MNDSPPWSEDTFWIVRSAGERTTAACAALIRRFVPAERVRIIEERPFSAAISRTYELGAASGATWTCCIDADVFIHAPGWRRLLAEARRVPPRVWYVQGLTIDKFIPIIRTAGTGIYRNSAVLEARAGIPPDGTSLRPETDTMQAMLARGWRMYRTPIVVGMHDFEQHYRDIARKMILHYHKHANVRAEMVAYWTEQREADADFAAALLGARLGEELRGTIRVDREFRQREVTQRLAAAGLAPKAALEAARITPEFVAEFVANFTPHAALQARKFPTFREYTDFGSVPRWERALRKLRHALTGRRY